MARWPLVRIVWLDSVNPTADWHRLSEWRGLGSQECVSVGYLIGDERDSKTIAPHVAFPDEEENCQATGIMIIPTGAVLRIESLKATASKRVSKRISSRPDARRSFSRRRGLS